MAYLTIGQYERRRDALSLAIRNDTREADDERQRALTAKRRSDPGAEAAHMWRAGRADERVARWRRQLDELNAQWRIQGGG